MSDSALAVCLLFCFAGCAAEPMATAPPPAGLDATEASLQGASANPTNESEAISSDRQIIYRATLELHVQDFAAVDREVKSLIKQVGGYVAQFREDRNYGAQRGGRWTVRVPADQFDRFLDETMKLGVTREREVTAEDVTEEYVDLSARLTNKQQLESRLLELVAKRVDDIKDVVALEAELSRVREEVERMQGRLRFLADRVRMTTVEITAYERQGYRPPEATFSGRIAHAFHSSLLTLRDAAEGCLLVGVALLPWFVTLALLLMPLMAFVRWRRRKGQTPAIDALPA